MKAVIWLAVSSQAQTGNDKISMEQQEKLARNWCAENGYSVSAILKVDGYSRRESDLISAMDEFRNQGVTAYDELRQLWSNHDFDVLVAYTHSRFGRSSTLHSFIIENVVQSGAYIYLIEGGRIDNSNYRAFTAIGGMMATTEVDRLVRARDAAMSARAARGLPTSSSIIPSHKIIRDDLGHALRVELDDSKHRLWHDAATLLLEGVGWKHIESELYKRYGHIDNEGKPYRQLRMYDWFHNPMFWGHSARHHRGSKKSDNGTKTDMWVFDSNVPPPQGVEIYYDLLEPVFKGDFSEKVKAELRRRRMAIRGSNRPHRSEPFSGLFICAECSYYLIYKGNKGIPTYSCVTRWETRRSATCKQRRELPAWKIQRWLDLHLEDMIAMGEPGMFLKDTRSEIDFYNRRISELEKELETTDRQMRNLIRKQAMMDDENLSSVYDEEIAKLHHQLDILNKHIAQTKTERPNSNIEKSQRLAFDELKELSLDVFWELSGVQMNQLLHQLLGNYRLVVEAGEIIGITEPMGQR